MKKTKTLLTILIATALIFIWASTSNAAIEIKQGTGSDAIVSTTISNSYIQCQNMKNSGQALGKTSVVPHLATNTDWGAVTYLSNSSYGTNSAGKNTGTQVTINNVKYYSTNGNLTGVMNWGANPNKTLYTQTSGIFSTYNPSSASSDVQTNVATIYENKDTRFVNNITTNNFNATSTRGMAMSETKGMYSSWSSSSTSSSYPCSVRQGLFGFGVGCNYGSSNSNYSSSGAAYNNVTFRPVVWNQ